MLRSIVVVAILPALALSQNVARDGPRGSGTKFSKCGGGLLFGNNDRCYGVIIDKINIITGEDGSKDAVTAKICSNDGKICCETPPQSSLSKASFKSFTNKKFPSCKTKEIPVQNGTLQVTLNRKGTDSLVVKKMFIEAKSVAADKKQTGDSERFECPTMTLSTTNSATQLCKTSPYVYHRVKKLTVDIGSDGTDDNVKVDICSNYNDVCCKTKLSGTFSDDWSKNSKEVWEEKHLGDCKTMLYKGSSAQTGDGLRLTVSKDGKDDIIINKITMETVDTYGKSYKYDCGGYKLTSDGFVCLEGVNCSQSKVCKIGAPKSPGSGKAPFGSSLTARKPSSASVRTTKPTIKGRTTTTRPPFRTG